MVVLTVFFFDRLVAAPILGDAAPEVDRRWRAAARGLIALALPLAILSGLAWFAYVAAEMSGLPWRQAMGRKVAGLVWSETHFGEIWRIRAALCAALLLACVAALLPRRRSRPQALATWGATLLSAALLASLAWAGHGLTGGPPTLHLAADAGHLLVGAGWPGGLLPLALLLARGRRALPAQWEDALPRLVGRFSTTAVVSVLLLAATGLVDTWSLVGSPAAMLGTTYGRVLTTKIALFCGMVAIGAANLRILRPRLPGAGAGRWLLRNVVVELILAACVIGAVAVLGLLPPPAEAHLHMHHHAQTADE